MSEIFDTVKDTFGGQGKGGKKAALPWIIAGVGVAGLALYIGSKRSNAGTSTGAVTGYNVPSGTTAADTSGEDLDALAESVAASQRAMADAFQKSQESLVNSLGKEIDRLDTQYSKLDTATGAAITQQQNALTSTVSSFTESIRALEAKTVEKTITPAPAGTGTVGAAAPVQADRLSQQVQAYQQIQALGAAWQKETDPAVRAALHGQAEAIGVTAGFGTGGASGAARVIPSDVLAAAGTGAK